MRATTLEYIRHSNLIEGIDDPKEDIRSLRAWQWLKEQPKIAQHTLLALHRKITSSQLPASQAGHYRKADIRSYDDYPPSGIVIQSQIYGWLIDLEEGWHKLDPKAMHIRFEKIHPFIDGNGRTGRMLMWWHELQLGRTPTLIRSDEADRQYYYGWFR